MGDELERIWNEAVVTNRSIIPAFAWKDHEKLRKTLVNIAGVLTMIRNGHLPSTIV
jgi:hypothetical protein